ncbi:DUF2496 domain-containing protein [Vibrio lentus]|nr:DUF2496 domain-containing protein [Vibrio lentus]
MTITTITGQRPRKVKLAVDLITTCSESSEIDPKVALRQLKLSTSLQAKLASGI